MLTPERIAKAFATSAARLLAERHSDGHWTGELSTSALSTATAVCALKLVVKNRPANPEDSSGLPGSEILLAVIQNGITWLVSHQNRDGGWGDTTLSHSNLSTTTLVWAALGDESDEGDGFLDSEQILTRRRESAKGDKWEVFKDSLPLDLQVSIRAALAKTEQWLVGQVGTVEPKKLAAAIIARYGDDRTFSVPILTLCALMGRLGSGPEAWRRVIPLPFELAACPPSWFAALRLPVVSYALPALIAMGYARHWHRPSRNPFVRLLRNAVAGRTLNLLNRLQPPNGGFLEATPLTSFVVMSLAGSGQIRHPVVRRGVAFLLASIRPDGSWPIDTNLATWVTTLSINALARRNADPNGSLSPFLDEPTRRHLRRWLLNQQYRTVHPYTQAPPGGWAWTDLPGGVPDADDTAGALLALRHLGPLDPELKEAAAAGATWLLNLQNRDGGIPTFCRGWGRLPFDRSAPDLTAHALRAWAAWQKDLPPALAHKTTKACRRAIEFLAQNQRKDGTWLPLWFGNQNIADESNPVYGTSRVVSALAECASQGLPCSYDVVRKGIQSLLRLQHPNGAWGDTTGHHPSIEETALAVEALSKHISKSCGKAIPEPLGREVLEAKTRGLERLVELIESGEFQHPAPIGFYFAKLWYYEKLYPLIFTVLGVREL